MFKSILEKKEELEKPNNVSELERALENGPDELLVIISKYCNAGVLPFIREVEALIKINNFEEKEKDEAYKMLLEKDGKTSEYKFSPSGVFDFITSEKD